MPPFLASKRSRERGEGFAQGPSASVLQISRSKPAEEAALGDVASHVVGQHHIAMDAISYTAARENLASTMDRVCRDRAPIVITRKRGESVVMVSLEDYNALEETAYLLRSPANAKRLLESIHAVESGVVRDV